MAHQYPRHNVRIVKYWVNESYAPLYTDAFSCFNEFNLGFLWIRWLKGLPSFKLPNCREREGTFRASGERIDSNPGPLENQALRYEPCNPRQTLYFWCVHHGVHIQDVHRLKVHFQDSELNEVDMCMVVYLKLNMHITYSGQIWPVSSLRLLCLCYCSMKL